MRWSLAWFLMSTTTALAMPAEVVSIIKDEAEKAGVDSAYALVVADIESSGSCLVATGSYRGLYQLSDAEFQRFGGRNIWDCRQNARVAFAKMVGEADTFRTANGHDPTALELYLIHQQGPEGQAAHYNHLDMPAWKSLQLYTREGAQRGMDWSQRAVWGNVPADKRPQFGDVFNITSRQFIEVWRTTMDRKLAAFSDTSSERYQCLVPEEQLRQWRGK